MRKLTPLQQQMLWGETVPYSEAKIILNTRILGDGVSRMTLEIDGNINPTTYKCIQKNKKHFATDMVVLQLLESARYEGKGWGYHVSMGYEEWNEDQEVMNRAKEKLKIMKEAILRMHVFVLQWLEEDA